MTKVCSIGNYGKPSLEGEGIRFSCPKRVLIGPNSTTCMGNGEWEPDPRKVACKVWSPSDADPEIFNGGMGG